MLSLYCQICPYDRKQNGSCGVKGHLEGFDDKHVDPDRGERDLHFLNELAQGVVHVLADVGNGVLNHLEDGVKNNYTLKGILSEQSHIRYYRILLDANLYKETA